MFEGSISKVVLVALVLVLAQYADWTNGKLEIAREFAETN